MFTYLEIYETQPYKLLLRKDISKMNPMEIVEKKEEKMRVLTFEQGLYCRYGYNESANELPEIDLIQSLTN